MRLSLGALNIPSRIIQSPLAGCSDLPFRLIARARGLGLAYAEMVSAQSLTRGSLKTRRLLVSDPADRPLGAQLRLTVGVSEKPLSSRNTRCAPRRSAFFYMWPDSPPPVGNRRFVPLQCAAFGLLAAPPQAV